MEIELSIEPPVIELRKEEMRCGNNGPNSLMEQSRQGCQRFRYCGSPIVHAWNQMAMEIHDRESERAIV
jgi:hypothetical protein